MNNNPAEMSNEDLENDMKGNNPVQNQENVNKSTAAEGELKTPAEEPSSAVAHETTFNSNKEQDIDDLVHRQAEEKHNGTMPDPEEVSNWEDRENLDKITGAGA